MMIKEEAEKAKKSLSEGVSEMQRKIEVAQQDLLDAASIHRTKETQLITVCN